jgi:hypothetical protein
MCIKMGKPRLRWEDNIKMDLWCLYKIFGKSFISIKVLRVTHRRRGAARLYDTVRNLLLKRKRILTSKFGKLLCSSGRVTDQFVVLICKTNNYGCRQCNKIKTN